MCHSCSNKCSPTLWLLDFFGSCGFLGLGYFGCCVFKVLGFMGIRVFHQGCWAWGIYVLATKVFGVKVLWSKAFGVQSLKVYSFRSLGFLGSIVFLGLKFLGSKV